MIDLSVVICTFNGAKRLPQVLERLKHQQITQTCSWEVIVVDNNSYDGTSVICHHYQSINYLQVPIHYCFESRQGLAYARRQGVQAAKGELIAFLDDDNLPHPTWLSSILDFSHNQPQAGAFGGQIYGKFDVKPPPNFRVISRFFALIEGDTAYCYNEKYANTALKLFPPGAGIVVRKKAWESTLVGEPALPQVGEDLEMLLRIWQAGWKIWFVPTIKIDHHIPACRLEPNYLMDFFCRNGLIRYPYRMLQYCSWQQPFMTVIYGINDLKKLLIFHLRNHGRMTDITVRCEQKLLLSILLSPIYYLGISLHRRCQLIWNFLRCSTVFLARTHHSRIINNS